MTDAQGLQEEIVHFMDNASAAAGVVVEKWCECILF